MFDALKAPPLMFLEDSLIPISTDPNTSSRNFAREQFVKQMPARSSTGECSRGEKKIMRGNQGCFGVTRPGSEREGAS
jgi:hypothetical protein